jgi:hypothetical protein
MLLLLSCGSDKATSPDQMIESVQLNDVWIFQQDSLEGNDAFHVGTAEIRNDCLYVGDAVVVWDHKQTSRAEELIASVNNGEQPEVSLGGRGTSLDKGDVQLPATITRLCPTRMVWYTSPTP